MKKFVFLFTVLLLVCTSLAFSQRTNWDNSIIWNTIQMSKEANEGNGIKNPDSIFPGQTLTFLFWDGTVKIFTVEHGDNEWKVIRDKVLKMEKTYGPVVNYPDTVVVNHYLPIPSIEPIKFAWYETEWIWAVPIGLILLVLFLKFFLDWYNKRNADPITAGPPQVQGGVNDASAHSRMHQVAGARFPGARIDIKNIRRGWLSGLAKVFYQGKKSKKINLKNVPAYAGEILVNGIQQKIYFLQGCGNDARMGNYMTGSKLVFTPGVVINTDGSESPLPPAPETQPSVTVPPVPVSVPDPRSEYHQHVIQVKEMFKEVLKSGEAYEVNIEVGKDSFKFSLKNKYDSKKVSKPAPEK